MYQLYLPQCFQQIHAPSAVHESDSIRSERGKVNFGSDLIGME